MKRLPLSVLMAVFFGWLLWTVSARQAALFVVGIGLGAVLAGKRFGFTTGWRMLVEDKDPRGVFGSCCCWPWPLPWPCLCLATFQN